MAEYHFCDDGGFVTVNGALSNSGFCIAGEFALGSFHDGCEPLFVKIPKRITGPVSPFVNVCDAGQGRYVLSFSPRLRNDGTVVVTQKEVHAGNVSHLVTVCKKGGYLLVVETADEIYELPLPVALSDLGVSAVAAGKGQLLKISAKAEDKDFIALLYYAGDYSLLFDSIADRLSFDGSVVVCTENLGGCNGCVRTRRLRFEKGAFRETEVGFVYKHCHDYPDELLPYVFFEKLAFKDDEGAQELLRRSLTVKAVKEIVGDFDGVCDFSFLPYTPFVAGVYSRAAYSRVRYYRFSVSDGLITDIRGV